MNKLFASAARTIEFNRDNKTAEEFDMQVSQLRTMGGHFDDVSTEDMFYDFVSNFYKKITENFTPRSSFTVDFSILTDENDEVVLTDVTTAMLGFGNDKHGRPTLITPLGTVTFVK